MILEEFVARRSRRLNEADNEIEPLVATALQDYVDFGGDWYEDLIQAESVLWIEIFEDEAGKDAKYDNQLKRFQKMLRESLKQTTKPTDPPDQVQITRVTNWLGTVAVNDATYSANISLGGRTMKWVTMHDDHVRPVHRATDGQRRTVNGTFDVGGYQLRYPGDPVGPPEIWINCRCLLAGGRVGLVKTAEELGTASVQTLNTFEVNIEEEGDGIHVADDETPPGSDELVDDEVEVPWHAVLAPEGVPTGDGRMFADGSLSTRDLPLPLLYQDATSDGHGGSVRIGVMNEAWRDENTKQWRARGTFRNTAVAQDVIDGIADGSIRGGSVDIDDMVYDLQDVDGKEVAVASSARIAGYTLVAIPAFQEAYIGLGGAFEDELSDEDLEALAACGCADGEDMTDVEYEADFREISQEERDKLAKEGKALPDGSFPIANEEDLRNAIQAIGRAADPEAAKKLIIKRAKELGKEDLIPEDWSALTAGATFAPGTKDGPGWITNPADTARIRRYWTHGKGAAKIRWGQPGDFNRCRRQLAKYVRNPEFLAGTCANMHKEALGIWPGQEAGKRRHHSSENTAPMFTLTAGASVLVDPKYFQNPRLAEPQGVVIDGDHVYGYVATWGVCHVGVPGKCETAPHSASNYAYYRTGMIETTEGDVPVGQITMATGHADGRMQARPAAAHYDNTGAVVADVATGEDAIGIWFSGLLRPGTDDETRRALRASGRLSGDWRRIGGSLELVAALAVNVPGFPITRPALVASAGHIESAIGLGVVDLAPEESLVASAVTVETMAGIARAAAREVLAEQKRAEKLAALTPFRQSIRSERISRVRSKITKEG